ncbi:non-structural maintenance of chromosomes element 1 homolog [Octopus bimaculoides]|uniref:Non-structural maintenance of chromosomes element 1 homolog n=1 Tax=Octopus bimaculoides TaxID=37653 RepID=A0A0L8HRT6_OCTBM|nr:non-structural maintenance of chromosomes element 1 homolog [Octopus bimaculoides]XP_014769973.1 non-structural maintenance of chromosomes element 1 homolog [Octopus bimaculoides]XP_052831844.1 non-structural maintenance of chromosomes element 1 homolog [Octopus bimaculoides]|eukprot:XP_014769972.1 PREDICTED: non-structural maintenance of chromosomes element 1 homolog [Octopus bimaculoides]
MSEMKPQHHVFLQYFMSKGLVDSKGVRNLFKLCCKDMVDASSMSSQSEWMQQLANFVIIINNNIRPFHLNILKGFDEDDGTSYYCLVNTCDNAVTRLSTDYSVNELELFKLFLDRIMSSSDASVGSVQALNLTHELEKKMSKDDAQRFFDRMVNEKWLKRTLRGKLQLSTRSILELDNHIRKMYPDLVELCNICNRLCLQGQSCLKCMAKLHIFCAKRYFENQAEPKCPKCYTPWTNTNQNRESVRRSSRRDTRMSYEQMEE